MQVLNLHLGLGYRHHSILFVESNGTGVARDVADYSGLVPKWDTTDVTDGSCLDLKPNVDISMLWLVMKMTKPLNTVYIFLLTAHCFRRMKKVKSCSHLKLSEGYCIKTMYRTA